MLKKFDPTHLWNFYTPSKDSLLEFIAPYMYALSHLMAERNADATADEYAQAYIANFIQKAQIKVGFIDPTGVLISASNVFEKWITKKCKKRSESLPNSIYKIFGTLPVEITEALQQNLQGESAKIEEIQLTGSKVPRTWITWESFPWFDTNGKVIGIIFFCQDITKYKELYFDVCKLYSRTELLEKFSLIFSHDLIQPLRQISTYVSFLETELEDEAQRNPRITENINALNRCISKTKEICEGVVVYCKNGDLTINREPVNLSEVISLTMEWCLTRSDIIIKNTINKDLILDVNKACALQLFQNLLDNAIKHSTNLPIEITLSGRLLENNYYEFTLHNNGWCGHSLKQKDVFNAFYSNYADGAGLGLMICKKIIDAYGGEIHFVSLPEKGTNITFSLPLTNEEEIEDIEEKKEKHKKTAV